MKKIFLWIENHFERNILVLSLITMVVLIILQVILRAMKTSLIWIEELARYIMLYQIWIGAAYAVKVDAHIRITSFIDRYTGNKKIKLDLLVLTIWLIFSIWLMIEGVILVSKIAQIGQTSPALQIPMYIPYFSVPFGGFLMSLRIIQKMKSHLGLLVGGND